MLLGFDRKRHSAVLVVVVVVVENHFPKRKGRRYLSDPAACAFSPQIANIITIILAINFDWVKQLGHNSFPSKGSTPAFASMLLDQDDLVSSAFYGKEGIFRSIDFWNPRNLRRNQKWNIRAPSIFELSSEWMVVAVWFVWEREHFQTARLQGIRIEFNLPSIKKF